MYSKTDVHTEYKNIVMPYSKRIETNKSDIALMRDLNIDY
jgi:hypothetical protein